MISSLTNYCIEYECNNYRWPGCEDNLCPLHCRISELEKKLKEINELVSQVESKGVTMTPEAGWIIIKAPKDFIKNIKEKSE